MTSEPERDPLTVDLCDVWLDVPDHQCQSYWREEIKLATDTEVGGKTMFGTYRAGTWRFCHMHARIFNRDRDT